MRTETHYLPFPARRAYWLIRIPGRLPERYPYYSDARERADELEDNDERFELCQMNGKHALTLDCGGSYDT